MFHVNFCTPYCLTSYEISFVALTLKEFSQKFETHSVCFSWGYERFVIAFCSKTEIPNHVNLSVTYFCTAWFIKQLCILRTYCIYLFLLIFIVIVAIFHRTLANWLIFNG